MPFVKGSKAAKDHMARLRGMQGGSLKAKRGGHVPGRSGVRVPRLGGGPLTKGGRFELPEAQSLPVKIRKKNAKGPPKRKQKPRPPNPLVPSAVKFVDGLKKLPTAIKPKRKSGFKLAKPKKFPIPIFSDRGREREFPEAPVDHVTDGRIKKRKLVKVKLPLHKGAALGPVRRKPKGPKGTRPKKTAMRLKTIHGPPVPTTKGPVRGLRI